MLYVRDVAFLLLKFELGGNINLLLYLGMSYILQSAGLGRLFKYITCNGCERIRENNVFEWGEMF